MGDAMSISAAGIQAASARFSAAASSLVRATSESPVPKAGGAAVTSPLAYDPAAPFANLPSWLVNLKEAAGDFRASLLVYKTSAQMFKTLLDATA